MNFVPNKSVLFCLVLFCVGSHTVYGGELDFKVFLGSEPLTVPRIVEDLVKYFQQDEPKGIPVLQVPDVVEVEGPYGTTSFTARNIAVFGHSDITIQHIDVNLDKLQVQVRVNIPRLQLLADYEWEGYFSTSAGDMNVTFIQLEVGPILNIGVNPEGSLEVMDVQVPISSEEFFPHLTGTSYQHSITITAADTLFEAVLLPGANSIVSSFIYDKVNSRLQERLKGKLFPVDISPVDYMIGKIRSDIIRDRNLDPIRVEKKEFSYMAVSALLTNIELRGLSSVHRSDVIRVEYVDNRFYITIEIGTQALKGSTDWALSASLLPIGTGHADILIESLRISVEVQQEADIRHPTILKRIDIDIGNIAFRSVGDRNFDYLLEAAVNIVPNVFKRAIIDKRVEVALKKIIQERFNVINLEHIINDQLKKMKN